MPGWVASGCDEYTRRMPPEMPVGFEEIPLARRRRNSDVARAVAGEGEALLRRAGRDCHLVALDIGGSALSTGQLADRLAEWRMGGRDVCLLIGGPDGLSHTCIDAAAERWSLSPLTLPHPLVRIVVAEQLYRAWSIAAGHPYHR